MNFHFNGTTILRERVQRKPKWLVRGTVGAENATRENSKCDGRGTPNSGSRCLCDCVSHMSGFEAETRQDWMNPNFKK
jgi:hypothetical protein